MLGVKEIPKVHTVDLTLYVWLCYRLSAFLTAFATSNPFFSLHSLQQLSSSYYIRNGSSNRASHSLHYHQWKDDMIVLLRTKHLFRLIEEIEEELESDKDKAKYMNRLDEAIGLLHSSVSRDLWFHIQELKTPKEVWDKLASLFDKQDEMRIHQLENDLITLNPSNFESLNEFFTKFKNLIYQLKQCKVDKDEDQLILVILTKLNSNYSVFISTFQTVRLTTPKWKIPTLNAFIQSLISENDKSKWGSFDLQRSSSGCKRR